MEICLSRIPGNLKMLSHQMTNAYWHRTCKNVDLWTMLIVIWSICFFARPIIYVSPKPKWLGCFDFLCSHEKRWKVHIFYHGTFVMSRLGYERLDASFYRGPVVERISFFTFWGINLVDDLSRAEHIDAVKKMHQCLSLLSLKFERNSACHWAPE